MANAALHCSERLGDFFGFSRQGFPDLHIDKSSFYSDQYFRFEVFC